MPNKKIIILIALGIAAIVSVIYGASAKPKFKKDVINQETAVKKAGGPAGQENIIGQTKRHAKRTQFRSWKRSPFIPKGVPGAPSSKLVLSGIIAKGTEFRAMIGDSIVVKGDKIDGNTVIDVKKDRVILNDGTKDFEIKLEQ